MPAPGNRSIPVSHWIDTPERLAAHLAGWAGQTLVALDTEFIRERTFYPQLALVQLAIPGDVLLVDPLVPGMADALRPLLVDASVTKLMHSASEDLQALSRGVGAVPEPLFDTQVAAAMAGYGAGLGYQKLVEQVTGHQLAKGETRSDWLKRPLPASPFARSCRTGISRLLAWCIRSFETKSRRATFWRSARRQTRSTGAPPRRCRTAAAPS